MTAEHKAFVFDYCRFESELMPILYSSLETGQVNSLRKFILQNFSELKDPYEGESLDSDWENLIEVNDPHQYGDFALTKFYNPVDDIGLGYNWEELNNLLSQEYNSEIPILLGKKIGPENNPFDPGKLGSYFQSPRQVQDNLELVKAVIEKKTELASQLDEVLIMFESAVSDSKGLYITF